MRLGALLSLLTLLLAPESELRAQKGHVQLAGTWNAETPEGPRMVVIRPDSSASYGDETVRWRVVGDSIHIAFGDEWMVYKYQVKGNRLTLSGGDLEDPITLKRTGPPTPRPDGVAVPPPPPPDRRGTGVNGKPSSVPVHASGTPRG